MSLENPVKGELIVGEDENPERKKIIRRDAWSDDKRGVPADIIRSGLFRVNSTRNRELLEDEPIGSIDGHHITYSGRELNISDDWKVIRQLIHLQKGFPVEDGFAVEKTKFVKDVFGNNSGFYYKKMLDSFDRMSSGTLRFKSRDKSVSINGVGLIRKFRSRDEKTDKELSTWHVWLEPEIISLLEHEIAITERLDNKKLSPQAIKVRDVIQNTDPSTLIYVKNLKEDVLHSKASDVSFRKMLLHKISDLLVEAGVITQKLEIDANGVLIYSLAGDKFNKEEYQLRLFDDSKN